MLNQFRERSSTTTAMKIIHPFLSLRLPWKCLTGQAPVTVYNISKGGWMVGPEGVRLDRQTVISKERERWKEWKEAHWFDRRREGANITAQWLRRKWLTPHYK